MKSGMYTTLLKQKKILKQRKSSLLVVDRVNNTDTSELKVEVKEEYFTDDMSTMVGLQKKLEGELRSVIGLGFKVRLVEPKGIERSEGKAKRVIDKRQL